MAETILGFLNKIRESGGQADLEELTEWINRLVNEEFRSKLRPSERKQNSTLQRELKQKKRRVMLVDSKYAEYAYVTDSYYIVQIQRNIIPPEYELKILDNLLGKLHQFLCTEYSDFPYELEYSNVCSSIRVQKQLKVESHGLWFASDRVVHKLDCVKKCMDLLNCKVAKAAIVSNGLLLLEAESGLRAMATPFRKDIIANTPEWMKENWLIV